MNLRILKGMLLLCLFISLISCTKEITNEFIDENKLNETLVSQCISATLEFEKLQDNDQRMEYIESIAFSEKSYAYLLDEEFNILEHPVKKLIGNNIFDVSSDLFVNAFNRLVEKESHIFYKYEYDNTEKLVFFYSTTNNDIVAIAGLETYK